MSGWAGGSDVGGESGGAGEDGVMSDSPGGVSDWPGWVVSFFWILVVSIICHQFTRFVASSSVRFSS